MMFKKIVPSVLLISSLMLLTSCSAPANQTTPAPSESAAATSTANPEDSASAEPENTDATDVPAVALSAADASACQIFVDSITTLYQAEPTDEKDFTAIDVFIASVDTAKSTTDITPELSADFSEVSSATTEFKNVVLQQIEQPESVTDETFETSATRFSTSLATIETTCTGVSEG